MADVIRVLKCAESPTGAHYWICEGQHGPTSESRCKYCGEIAKFRNAINRELDNKYNRGIRIVD